MVFVNEANKVDSLYYGYIAGFVQLLAPVAPHLGEELWAILGNEGGISYVPWPTYDESALQEEQVEVVLQINGKVRAKVQASAKASKEELEEIARNNSNIQERLADKTIHK